MVIADIRVKRYLAKFSFYRVNYILNLQVVLPLGHAVKSLLYMLLTE